MKIFAAAAFSLASITDYWDGKIARERNETSVFGKLMDPIADKALILSAFFGFAAMHLVDFRLAMLVATRDILVTGFRLSMQSTEDALSARGSGKQKTVLQISFVLSVLLFLAFRETPLWREEWGGKVLGFIQIGMGTVTFLTLLSGLRYLWVNRKSAVNPQIVKLSASFFFVGFAPLAPGTWGSAAGLLIGWFALPILPYLVFALTLWGLWMCAPAQEIFQNLDPGQFVLDEVCGMCLGVLWLPATPALFLAAFLIFRALDTLKPWPIILIQRSKSPSSIMWDDIAAGVATNFAAHLLILTPFFRGVNT